MADRFLNRQFGLLVVAAAVVATLNFQFGSLRWISFVVLFPIGFRLVWRLIQNARG